MTDRQTTLRYHRVPFHAPEGEDILKRVELHWEKMRGASPVPARSAMAPEPLDEILSHCFILERVAPTIARFRVAGQAMTDMLGMEARSMPLSSLFSPQGRTALEPLVATVCDGPDIVEIPVTTPRGFVRSPVRGRLLMLPMADRNGGVTRIFGAFVLDGKPGRRGLRFDLDPSQPLRCKRVSALLRNIAELKPERPQTRPLDIPPAAKPRPAAQPLRRGHPHLRLVIDNT